MRMCVFVCVRYHTSIRLCMHVLCGCPPEVQRVLVEWLQLSKITTTALSTRTSAEVLSTTSTFTFRVVYIIAAEHFIDQVVVSVEAIVKEPVTHPRFRSRLCFHCNVCSMLLPGHWLPITTLFAHSPMAGVALGQRKTCKYSLQLYDTR